MVSRPLVPAQLLGRQPAHALDEAALDLAEVDRRIDRAADVVQEVGAQHPVLAGERIDDDLGHGGAVGEIVERPAAGAGAVVPDLGRAVEPGRRELDAVLVGEPRELGEARAAVADPHLVAWKRHLLGRHLELLRGNSIRRP